MGRWACARCGACCKELLSQDGGHLFGIYLDPSEAGFFPKDAVSPLLGRGDPIVITAYQLNVNRCPNYAEESGVGSCAIREHRPLVCRAFPVVSRFRVSTVCPGVRRLDGEVDRDSLKPELEAHGKKLSQAVEMPDNEWVWPLNVKRWVRIKPAPADAK